MRTFTTSEVATGQNYTVLLYGDNRSGKTHFTGTWPRPLYIVPEGSTSEMLTLRDENYTVVPFRDMVEFRDSCTEVAEKVKANKPIEGYVPRTVVIDNLTTAQMLFAEEIKSRRQINKLEWGDWDQVKSNLSYTLVKFLAANVHLIWICHCRTITIADPDNPKQQIVEAKLTINGQARDFIPNHADMLLYAEQVDMGARGAEYRIHGRKKGIFPAGVRLPTSDGQKPFEVLKSDRKQYGMFPSYDQLAPYFNLPTVDEDWDAYEKRASNSQKEKRK